MKLVQQQHAQLAACEVMNIKSLTGLAEPVKER